MLTETLYVLLLTVGTYLTVRTLQEHRPALAAGAGVAFAAAALARPTILVFPLLLVAVGLLRREWRHAAAVGGLAVVLVMAPWVIRNEVQVHGFVVTSTESSFILWQGNSPGATGGTRGYMDSADYDQLPMPKGTTEIGVYHRYLDGSTSWMKAHPGRVVALAPKKLANLLRPTYADASTLNDLATLATYPMLVGFGIAGLVLIRRRDRLVGDLFVLFLAYHLVVHATVTGMIRFRVPIEAMLCIPAGIAVAALSSRLAARA
ncbi:MAG: family glycosyltransferase, 4-amino-4-deoxy-L-arabinose transferase [Actinomycetia bacterium]|nr:family glycosyltransferase, 4-amino-4-deoxy-L-arabinose transferase [Actinomycetes bacterium]